jgi:hypothetical protein
MRARERTARLVGVAHDGLGGRDHVKRHVHGALEAKLLQVRLQRRASSR